MAIHIENTIWIDRTPSDVFAFITTPQNLPKFVPGLTSARPVDKVGGEGTQLEVQVSVLGFTIDITTEWTQYEPGKTLRTKNIVGPVAVNLYTLHDENGGTRLERVMDMEPAGFLEKLAAPVIRRNTERTCESEFATLKDLLEN